MYPKPSRIYCIESRTSQFLTLDQAKKFYHNGNTFTKGRIACAVFKKSGDTKTYIQPWAWLSFLRVPGEKNVSAKLTDAGAADIFLRSRNPKSNADSVKELAAEYGVSIYTIRSIKNMTSWRHVTVPIVNPPKNKPAPVVSATNTAGKGTKISGSIAKFIARDNILHKIPVKKLAEKYNLSKSSIRRIVSGKAWKDHTQEILKELNKWAV